MADTAIWIALLRGINVGGHNKVPMADLRKALEAAGFAQVKTYIQSGNIVLASTPGAPEIARQVGRILNDMTGNDIAVQVLTPGDVARILEADLPQGDPSRILIHILPEGADAVGEIAAYTDELPRAETLTPVPRAIVHHAPDGISASRTAEKLTRVLPQGTTARNLRTLHKLLALADDAQA